MSASEINALITLIEDPDEGIFDQVQNKLVSYGEQVLPHLERFWEFHSFGDLFQNRIEGLIQSIQYTSIRDRLLDWKNSEEQDLLEGILLINRYQYPTFDEQEVRHTISKMRQDIWLELNDNLTALEIVRIINHLFFEVHGFQGNKQNYNSPQNSFIADVLSTKKGNPLSLAIIYQIVSNSLDIPIYGVNLPNHFVLCYLDDSAVQEDREEGQDNAVLFYINPFSGGTVIHGDEIDEFLGHMDMPQKTGYYSPCSNVAIINRMIKNLIYAYKQLGKDKKVGELMELQVMMLEQPSF